MSLSVVLATYNEEHNIEECINSFKSIADEIVVVDGTSLDSTAMIAKSLGAKVISVPNNTQFHTNKQLAIEAATGDWVLQLDADERVSELLAREILEEIKGTDKDGFYIPRKNWFLGRFLTKGGAYPDPVLRLFRKGKGSFVHDQVIDNGITTSNVHAQISVDGSTGMLRHDLIHYGDMAFEQYLKRFNRYTQLEAKNLSEMGLKASFAQGASFLLIKPVYWFVKRYLRHRGYVDGYQGFLFALLSALHYPMIYLKLLEIRKVPAKT